MFDSKKLIAYRNQYSDKQLEEKYNVFIEMIQSLFSDSDRVDSILGLHEYMAEHLIMAPASGIVWYHNVYYGGYIDHVTNVINNVKLMAALFYKQGGKINFKQEEMVFAALFHDFGKLGTYKDPYYIPQESEWHIKNKGELFVTNEALDKITVTDRSLLMLQEYAIKYSQTEWLAIKTSDGMYDETNKYYLVANIPGHKLKTNLPYVLHWADHMASVQEYDKWKYTTEEKETEKG